MSYCTKNNDCYGDIIIPVLREGIYPSTLPDKNNIFIYFREDGLLYYFDQYGEEYIIKGEGEVAVIDNLTSDYSNRALSARQGKVLDEKKVDKVVGKGLSSYDFTLEYRNSVLNFPINYVAKEQGKVLSSNDFTDEYKNTIDTINSNYVHSESGKGLSTNDFTNMYKNTIDNLPNNYVAKEVNKGLSSNDFTDEYKQDLDTLSSSYVHVQSGKGLSTNDYSNNDKNKLSGIESGAQINSPIENNLNSTETTHVLSADQGRILNQTKVDKIANKQLSTNDFTNTLKDKLDSVEIGAQVNSDIIDNLTSTRINASLSAKQGKELNDKIITINVGQVTLGKLNTLEELNDILSPVKGDRYIIANQINPDNNLPYYFVYNGTDWVNSTETIMNSDALTKTEFNNEKLELNNVIFNTSQYNNNYNFTNNTTARLSVPSEIRKQGQIISYKMNNDYWVTEQFTDQDLSKWVLNEFYNVILTGKNIISSEFINVWLDDEDKVLLGIRYDGSLYSPTIEKLILEGSINTENINELNTIITTLSNDIDQIKNISPYILNDEENRLYLLLDSDDKVIGSINDSGELFLGAGVNCKYIKSDTIESPVIDNINNEIENINNLIPEIIDNPEYLYVILDQDEKVIFGIDSQGDLRSKTLDYLLTLPAELDEIKEVIPKVLDENGYLYVITDSENKILFSKSEDGKTYDSDYDLRFKDIYNKIDSLNSKIDLMSEKILSDLNYTASKDVNLFYLNSDDLLKDFPYTPVYIVFVGGNISGLSLYEVPISLGQKIEVNKINDILFQYTDSKTINIEYYIIDNNNKFYR